MEDGIQHRAQATDAGLKDLDAAKQYPEALIPMGKTTGENTKRWAPDLDSPWFRACIAEPESVGMTLTGDLSMTDREVRPTVRRIARRCQSDLPAIITSKDSHRLPGGYVLGSVVFSQ